MMELPMKDWIDEAKINSELVITQLFAKFEAENERLKSRLTKCDEALAFYATECNGCEEGYISNALSRDNGQRAREALEEK